MTSAAILSVFAGMLIGLRLKVMALVPATILVGIAAFVFTRAHGESVLHAALAVLVSIVAVQIGYACATFAVALKDAPGTEAAAPVDGALENADTRGIVTRS